jgi:hypothetical protein
VDAVCLSAGDDFEDCAKVAARDDRAVITRGNKHHARLRQLADDARRCYMVTEEKTEEQVSGY